MQLAQPRVGLDAELFDEEVPAGLVGLERLHLATGPPERGHELLAEPFLQGLLFHERAQLVDDLAVPAEPELGVVELVRERRSQFSQAAHDGLEAGSRQPEERFGAPQVECLAKASDGILGAVQLTRLPQRAIRPYGVDPYGLGAQAVAVGSRLDAAPSCLTERAPERGDLDRDLRPGGLGRLLGPDQVDQPVHRDGTAQVDSERGQHLARPPSREVDRPPVHQKLHRTQDPHLRCPHGTAG